MIDISWTPGWIKTIGCQVCICKGKVVNHIAKVDKHLKLCNTK